MTSYTNTNYAAARPISIIGFIGLILAVVGGLNWGLVGLFNFDLVAAIFGMGTMVTRAVYVLVAVGAIAGLVSLIASRSTR